MLGIALGAMLLGCLLLVLILNRYEFKTKVSALDPSRRDGPGLRLAENPENSSTVRL